MILNNQSSTLDNAQSDISSDEIDDIFNNTSNNSCKLKVKICRVLQYIAPCFICSYYVYMDDRCYKADAIDMKMYGKLCDTSTRLCIAKQKICSLLGYILPCFICKNRYFQLDQ